MSADDSDEDTDLEDVTDHYASGYEAGRLQRSQGRIEAERTRELLDRLLPQAPCDVLDIGGGPGDHACWLARRGHRVHLIDIVPEHVELARRFSKQQADAPLVGAEVGDARLLTQANQSVDAALLLGPLYHLTKRGDRVQALREAWRVLRPGGVMVAAAISRFASTFDGLRKELLRDPVFVRIVARDLEDGQHRNPTRHKPYFTDAFFHHPDELRAETSDAGFHSSEIYGIEGPAWLAHDLDAWWDDVTLRETLLTIARKVEREPALLGVSAHMLVVATKRA